MDDILNAVWVYQFEGESWEIVTYLRKTVVVGHLESEALAEHITTLHNNDQLDIED